jgi:hypothetical protein
LTETGYKPTVDASTSTEALTALAERYGSDKWNCHWYAQHYDFHFSKYRTRPVSLLELGIGGYADPTLGGQSLRMWKAFFPLGRVVGLDIFEKFAHVEDRIVIYQGSQVDRHVLRRIIDDCGPFDIIVDDGSHESAHVIASFEYLFTHGLAANGIYAVEDLQTSYWRRFGGSEDLDNRKTSMAYFKRICDRLNWREWHKPGYRPNYFDEHVVSLHFYHNLVFVYKGENTEESNLVQGNVVSGYFRKSRINAAGALVKRSLRKARALAHRVVTRDQ